MIPSPQPAQERKPWRETIREKAASLSNLGRGVLPALATFLCYFLLPFIRWFQIPSPFAAAFCLLARKNPAGLPCWG